MQALVYYGRKDIRLEEFPEPARLGAQDVRLRVKCAALCHTDFNEYLHGPLFISQKPHPRSGRSIPLIIGHEFCGEVTETGSDVRRLKVADRVAVNAIDPCLQCLYCSRGLYELCRLAAYIGFDRDGGFAEGAVVPEHCCHVLNPRISDQAGALVEPLAVALHAVNRARVRIGSRVAVVGGGAAGLCVLQCLRTAGVRDVYLIEKCEAKRRFADQFGASAFINSEHTDPQAAILGLTEGAGVDTTFECVGVESSFRLAVQLTCGGGTVCVVGVFPGPFEFDLNALMGYELKVVMSRAYGDEFPTVIAMLSDGRLAAEPLITRRLRLSDALGKGLSDYDASAASNVRTIIEIST
jgi:(R,R)-butanediol dehydrogenase / meso-butanediol dehydrogenase / diacetyl reductase